MTPAPPLTVRVLPPGALEASSWRVFSLQTTRAPWRRGTLSVAGAAFETVVRGRGRREHQALRASDARAGGAQDATFAAWPEFWAVQHLVSGSLCCPGLSLHLSPQALLVELEFLGGCCCRQLPGPKPGRQDPRGTGTRSTQVAGAKGKNEIREGGHPGRLLRDRGPLTSQARLLAGRVRVAAPCGRQCWLVTAAASSFHIQGLREALGCHHVSLSPPGGQHQAVCVKDP